jgi:hypothetical protein
VTSRHDANKRQHARGRGRRSAAALLLCFLLAAAWQPAHAQRKAAPPPPHAPLPSQDGPFRVTFAQLFKEGKTDFDDLDPATVAPLPRGYVLYGKAAYKVESEAVAAGTYAVEFAFPSVADRAVFESLRVLYAEWDKVDEKAYWVDSVYAGKDGFKSDFGARTLTVRVKHLGAFAVARLVEPPKPYTKEADLSVEIVAPRGRVNGNTDVHYEVKITNRGPDDATNVYLAGAGFSSDQFVSASGPERGHGRCKQDGSNYACKLDLLEKGATAVFQIVLNPRENPRLRLPDEGEAFNLDAAAYGRERDENFEDNHAESWIQVYPDPNRAPTVELLTPKDDDLFTAPAEIRLSARAADPEGGLAKVQFYDGEKLVGEGIPAGKDEYRFDWAGVQPGAHIVTVVVTDDGGRSDYVTRATFVNGPLTVRVESPREGTVLKTKYRMKGEHEIEFGQVGLNASAGVGGARVKEIKFILYGLAGRAGRNRGARRGR